MNSLTIYKSSAGSGKTTVLSREYLKLALKKNFRNILAVTFTNKATNELKERVIQRLSAYSSEEPTEESESLRKELDLDEISFKEKCHEVLSQILNNYGVFSISTIDAFFQRIIRSFARESGIQGNFRLELEPDEILDEAIARLFEEAGKNELLTKWLIRFSHETVDNAQGTDLRSKVRSLGMELFQEEFKVIQEAVATEGKMERFEKLENDLFAIKFEFETELKKSGTWVRDELSGQGLKYSDLKKGIGKQIENIRKGEPPELEKPNFSKALVNPENFVAQNHRDRARVINVIKSGIFDELNRIRKYVLQHQARYFTAKVILENLYVFGIISDLLRKIDEYKLENDLLLLSDSSVFLAQIIRGYDSPFIYEKVGSRYQHFLIDEFQDTSRFQWNNFQPLLENSLAEGQGSVIVGDVKQSIYRWRGGDWNLLAESVNHQFPHSSVENLTTNWRSNTKVIQFNNRFFNDAVLIARDLYQRKASEKAEGDVVVQLAQRFDKIYSDIEQEVPAFQDPEKGYANIKLYPGKGDDYTEFALERMVRTIESLQQKGLKARDIAILVRKRSEGEKIASYIISHSRSERAIENINYDVVSSEILRVANSPSVNLLLGVLKWINKEEDRISLVSFLSDYFVYFSDRKVSLSKLFEEVYSDGLAGLLPKGFEENLNQIKKLQLYELSEEIIRQFGLMERKQEWPYLLGFQDELIQFLSREAGDLDSFLQWWEQHGWEVPVNISEEIDAIRIMTIHKAKGLQFEAVIIPFCHWNIEPEQYQQDIIWAGIEEEPFNQFSYYPLKYSGNLAKSLFVEDYLVEKFSHYIDNLNLLYVAFTRAIQGIYAIVPTAYSEDTVGSLVAEVIKSHVSQGEDELSVGQEKYISPSPSESSEKTLQLTSFHSNRWNDKVTVATKELIKLKEDVYEKVELGVIMHSILSELEDQRELGEKLEEYRIRGRINNDQRSELQARLDEILKKPEVMEWFEGEVVNEGVILGGKGIIRRPDKVVISDEKVVVIDFKTGMERPEHAKQVREYITLLENIYKKRVEGLICYLQPFNILTVE